ncbi:unnamed protein product [Calypogeia fissa]
MLSSVCHAWRDLFRGEQLFNMRAKLQCVDRWLLVLRGDPLSFFSYDLKSKRRNPLPQPDDAEQVEGGYKCAAVGTSFVVLGGVVKDAVGLHGQPTLNLFDTITQRWSEGANMLVPRCYFACGVIAGKLYVAGGYNGCGELELSGEVYDFKTKEWSPIAPMPFGLANIESDAVFKDRLFIKGRALSAQDDQRKVLSYDPVRNIWENNDKLERGLLDGEFMATCEELYVMNRTNYIGKYDEESAQWEQVGRISPYFLPFECPKKSAVCFGKEVFFLNTLAGNSMGLYQCSMAYQVLPKVYWQWQGAIIEA